MHKKQQKNKTNYQRQLSKYPWAEHTTTVDLIEEESMKKIAPVPAQEKLRAEIAGINEELASYACIEEKAGLSVDYKKRVKEFSNVNLR